MNFFTNLFKKRENPAPLNKNSKQEIPVADEPLEFVWLNKQGVRSNKGFEVQFTGRFEAVYSQGNLKITLYVESGVAGNISIKKNAFERWDHSSLRNSPERQAEMLNNFKAALDFQGLRLDV